VFVRHDVTSEESWREGDRAALERFGRLDVLVNNAGIIIVADIESTTVEQLAQDHGVNSTACSWAASTRSRRCARAAADRSSTSRRRPAWSGRRVPAYSASKGAVRLLTKSVAAHCRDKGDAIRCNSIHPGGVDTPLLRAIGGRRGLPDLRRSRSAGRAVGYGTPADIRPPRGLSRLGRVALHERLRGRDRRLLHGGLAMTRLPAVALAAVPGRRRATLELARELEAKGFAGAYCASFGDASGCARRSRSRRRRFRSAPRSRISTRASSDFAQTARSSTSSRAACFQLGVGVSHAPLNERLGVSRRQSARRHARVRRRVSREQRPFGELRTVVVAALRKRMVALAGELADGVVFANAGALAHA
jgi:NAD(P)-dependent dehydrogenase (short-subunit alcohol dehydrogenase family)